MSQTDLIMTENFDSDKQDHFILKENHIQKDFDNNSLSENQHSTDDQNSSRDIQKINESASKEIQFNQDKSNLIIQDQPILEDDNQNIKIEKSEDLQPKQCEVQQEIQQQDNCCIINDQTSKDKDEMPTQNNSNQENNKNSENKQDLDQDKKQSTTEFTYDFDHKSTEQLLKESREQDARVHELIRSTQESIQKTLDSTNRTLESVAKTMVGIEETNKKFDQFTNMYEQTMNQFGQRLAEVVRDTNLDNEDDFIPQITDVEELVQTLKYKNEAVFILGQGLFNVEKNYLQNKEYFEKQNAEYWKTYGIFKDNMSMNGSNQLDDSIAQVVSGLSKASVNSTLISTSIVDGLRGAIFNHTKKNENQTQSNQEESNQMTSMSGFQMQCYDAEEQKSSFKQADNNENQTGDEYDFDLFSGKYNYFQINGNLNFIRCSNQDCENKNKPEFLQSNGPIFQKPLCSKCQSPMRPHIKFNEEENDENTFNVDWIKARVNQLDCLVLVDLDENEKKEPLYQELIQKCIEYGILIVEISNQPSLEIGYIRQLIGYPAELMFFLRDQLLYS